MSDPVAALEVFAADLIARLEPAERKALAKRIAKAVRASQQQRIAAQKDPDGNAFEPRKTQLRAGRQQPLRAMFRKLRTTRFMRLRSSADEAIVGFTADVSRIARVHQEGLRDRVDRKRNIEVDYPARPLLGISTEDEALIRDLAIAHLADRL